MLKIFASGLAANLAFVLSGLFKQYLIAGALSVPEFGMYGTLVAIASLLLVLIPFPAYLDVMIRGFSAPSSAFGTRKRLLRAARSEMTELLLLAAVIGVALLAYGLFSASSDPRYLPLALLLPVQYMTVCLDLLLRMQQAHGRIALFMVTRNVPALALLLLAPPASPLHVALIDCATALLVTGCFSRVGALKVRGSWLIWRRSRHLGREAATLWLARLAQFGNASLLRLLVPLFYAAHETGLFFFALIAQLPCSLFLSVTTQMFGHTLARLPRGDWRTLWRTQALFVLPNLLYLACAALVMPFWAEGIAQVPKLSKYGEAGPLVLSVVLYGAVLASDCQEYLLRARGLARVLLAYSCVSIVIQLGCVALCGRFGTALSVTIGWCAAAQSVVLLAFSAYSFRKVVGPAHLEMST